MEEKENKSGIPSVEARAETVSGGQENGQAGKKTDNQAKARRELTPKQVQQRKKLLVYPLMGLLFLGSMWLIFAPSDKKDGSRENVGAFNADIPLPENDGIIGDKRKAYEQAGLEKKQADKVRSLQDFAIATGGDGTDAVEMDMPDSEPERELSLIHI